MFGQHQEDDGSSSSQIGEDEDEEDDGGSSSRMGEDEHVVFGKRPRQLCEAVESRHSTSSEAERSTEVNHKPVPPYLNRQGFIPRKIEDFGDGGAFPEIHIAQYPLDMGRHRSAKPGSGILPVTVDAHGNVSFDAIVKQNENAKKIVHSQLKDFIPKILMNDEESEEDEGEEK
ncbi:hypothetical protein LWI29_003327 [Acer saccharum]|uniref:Uncharacterized protein n=1 Tax=Acer saccharum TaxID=4024 RepID=A0AA39T6Y9_ACESA|nr:hypothetical protein LWI29_003327 [Acer saccharum]